MMVLEVREMNINQSSPPISPPSVQQLNLTGIIFGLTTDNIVAIIIPLITCFIGAWLGYKLNTRLEKKKHLRSLTEKRVKAYTQFLALFNTDDNKKEIDLTMRTSCHEIILIGDEEIVQTIIRILDLRRRGLIDDAALNSILNKELIPMMRENILENKDKTILNWTIILDALKQIPTLAALDLLLRHILNLLR